MENIHNYSKKKSLFSKKTYLKNEISLAIINFSRNNTIKLDNLRANINQKESGGTGGGQSFADYRRNNQSKTTVPFLPTERPFLRSRNKKSRVQFLGRLLIRRDTDPPNSARGGGGASRRRFRKFTIPSLLKQACENHGV